jgi:hypothetical protein
VVWLAATPNIDYLTKNLGAFWIDRSPAKKDLFLSGTSWD